MSFHTHSQHVGGRAQGAARLQQNMSRPNHAAHVTASDMGQGVTPGGGHSSPGFSGEERPGPGLHYTGVWVL